ncbi:glycosyltransferase family 1 protein [Spirosoma luteolum]
MSLIYLFRSPGTGHSIEELFGHIRQAVARQTDAPVATLHLPHISRGLRSVWQNCRFVARQRLSGLVHITGDVHYVALALPGRRTILTIHDCILLEKNRHRPLRYALFWWLWYYAPIRRAAVVTTVSEKTRQDLIRLVGRLAEKVVVVPNACHPDFRPQPAPYRTHCPHILQIGTAPHKNLPRLIDALTGLPCQLTVIGPLLPDLMAQLRQRRIRYEAYEHLSRAAIVARYAHADLVSFVSTYEGFGMPILEAQATGRPVLTSQRSPLTEVGGPDGACYVDPYDPAAIRAAIERIGHDDAYRQGLIEAGFQNVARYTPDRIAGLYARLYASLQPTQPAYAPH